MKGALLVGGTAAVAAVVTLAAWAQGFRYGGDSPPFVLSVAPAALVSYLVSAHLSRLGERAVGRAVLAVSASLLLYLVSAAVAAQYAGVWGRRDAFAVVAVIVHTGGYILPITLLQVCFLVAASKLGALRRRGELGARVMLGYSLAFFLFATLALPVGEPYEDIRPLLALGAAEEWTWVAPVPWLLGVLAGPVLLWRAVRRARGESRSRLLMVAVLSLAPIGTILFCVLSAFMAYGLGLLSAQVSEVLLAAAFALPFLLCAVGLREALGTTAASATESWLRILATFVAVPFFIIVVAVSAMIGSRLGSVLPIVVATLLVAGVFAVMRRRLLRTLLLWADPVRARTARLVREHAATLSPAAAAQEILRDAFGEPGLRLLLRLPEGRGWVSADGAAVQEGRLDGADTGQRSALVPFGHSALLVGRADPGEVPGCLAELAPLIDRAVLEMAVRDQAARVEAAVSDERRRLERDLHDGVQGRLLALALDLKMAGHTVDGEARLLLSDAAEGLGSAIGELRALAGGAMPDLLSRRGSGWRWPI